MSVVTEEQPDGAATESSPPLEVILSKASRAQLIAEIERLTEELKTGRHSWARMRGQLGQRAVEEKRLRDQVAGLERQLTTATALVNPDTERLQQLERQLAQLNADGVTPEAMERLRDSNRRLGRERQLMEDRLAEAQQARSAEQRRAETLQQQLQVATQHAQMLEQQLAEEATAREKALLESVAEAGFTPPSTNSTAPVAAMLEVLATMGAEVSRQRSLIEQIALGRRDEERRP